MEAPDTRGRPSRARPLRLLLVEDNDIAAAVVRSHVGEAWPSAEVRHEGTLGKAIEAARDGDWDVVLLDLGLPQCHGLEALQRLREANRTAPIVVITAREDSALAAEALEEEAQDYLSKAEVDPTTLARAIRYAMGRQHILVRMQRVIEEARTQERNLHELLRRSTDGVLVFDAESSVMFANAAAEPMFGMSAGALYGTRLDVIDLEHERTEIEVPTEAGIRVLDVRVVPVDWLGHASRMALVRDLTERRRSEELRAQLQRSERLAAVGKLAAGIAHEINNPLTYVMGSLDLMHREFDDLARSGANVQRLRMLCGGALEGVERVVGIVRDLSVFSRRDRDERVRPTNVQQALDSALKMVQPQLQHRARIERDYGEVELVIGQMGRLTQVFVNLLVNAAHAIQEGHVETNFVRVRTWQQDDRVFAVVQDSGCGVDADVRRQLFEPFFTTKQAGEGTGLGLYVCRSIIDSYGGDIQVISQPGRGTKVEVSLRAWDGPSRSDSVPCGAPESEPPASARVLVIDDEERIRHMLHEILSPQHTVVMADSGRSGQAILTHDRRFDLILCDVVMDDMSGLELEEWLREQAPELMSRFCFMTGGGIGEHSSRVPARGGERLLIKPFRQRDVHALLRRVSRGSPGAKAH